MEPAYIFLLLEALISLTLWLFIHFYMIPKIESSSYDINDYNINCNNLRVMKVFLNRLDILLVITTLFLGVAVILTHKKIFFIACGAIVLLTPVTLALENLLGAINNKTSPID